MRLISLPRIATVVMVLNICLEKSAQLPHSVTRFEGLERYYMDLRNKREQNQRFAIFRREIGNYRKMSICQSIFHENFNHYQHPTAVLIYPTLHVDQLRENYEEIFNSLFVEGPKYGCIMCGPKQYRYLNLSKKRTVALDGRKVKDYAFMCLVREVESTTIRPYYISRNAYNMNEVPHGKFIPGRFIFVENSDKELIVYALAEVSPEDSLHRIPIIQEMYLSRRASFRPAGEAKDDPICKLDAAKKLRLCNAVFMYELRHWKFHVGVDIKCEYKHFAFWSRYPRVYEFGEWMIECLRIPGEANRVFVSRGYNDNEVFVFLTYDNELMIHYLSSKVSVVYDRPVRRRDSNTIDDEPED